MFGMDLSAIYDEPKKLAFGIGLRVLSGTITNSTTGILGRSIYGGINYLTDKYVGKIVDKSIKIPSSPLLQLRTKVFTHICVKTLLSKLLYDRLSQNDLETIDAFKLNGLSTTLLIGLIVLLEISRSKETKNKKINLDEIVNMIHDEEALLIQESNVVEEAILEFTK